ncbi:MAG: transcription termination factor Rho [Proteobacteria bacterium]|nr:transcription termination factor Rho [Pseudomonadota bacterium]
MEKKEKPLEKMTAKELREVALEIPEIKGVHAMKKEELLAAIREARGIAEEVKREKVEAKKEKKVEKKRGVTAADLKKKIREFKALKEEAIKKRDARMAKIYKRRINRLKKRTRKAA